MLGEGGRLYFILAFGDDSGCACEVLDRRRI